LAAAAVATVGLERDHAPDVVELHLGGLGHAAADAEEGEGQHEALVHAVGDYLKVVHRLAVNLGNRGRRGISWGVLVAVSVVLRSKTGVVLVGGLSLKFLHS
jgi:hypothetical protein